MPTQLELSGKPDKRSRRTKEQMDEMYTTIEAIVDDEHPLTLRRLYYRLIGAGKIGKLETEYDNVGNMLIYLRECGRVPWDWVVDNTRHWEAPTTFRSKADALRVIANVYRLGPWLDQDCLVFCITEKDALSAILLGETEKLVVPRGVIHGSSSRTFLHETAEKIKEVGKPTFIYYLGDLDPAGVVNIERAAERTVRRYALDAEIYWHHLAVTKEQIVAHSLITRETKYTKIRQSHEWLAVAPHNGESCEVDVMPTGAVLNFLIEAMQSKLDPARYAKTLRRERRQRKQLRDWVSETRRRVTKQGQGDPCPQPWRSHHEPLNAIRRDLMTDVNVSTARERLEAAKQELDHAQAEADKEQRG